MDDTNTDTMHPQQRDYHEQASTLIVTVESEEAFRRGVEEGITALEQDKPEEVDGTPVVSFTSYEHLLRTITPETLALIETIRRDEPSSINETARVTGRDVKNIHDELTRLSSMGIIDLVEEGQSKRPIVWYDELDIMVPLLSGDDAETAVEV